MRENTVVVAEAATAGKATMYTGGGASVVAWWQGLDWLALAGFFIAVIGLAINFYFSWQRNMREKAEHEIKMRKLNEECNNAK